MEGAVEQGYESWCHESYGNVEDLRSVRDIDLEEKVLYV